MTEHFLRWRENRPGPKLMIIAVMLLSTGIKPAIFLGFALGFMSLFGFPQIMIERD